MECKQNQGDNMSVEQRDSEIDLIDLLETIWKGRYLLLAIVVVSALVGFLVLRTMPSQYAIDVTIDNVGVEGYHQIYPTILSIPEYQVPKPDHAKYYDKLLLQISSLNMAKSFWTQRAGKDIGDELAEEEFKFFYRNLNLEAKNNKLPELTARKLTILHVDGQAGVELLNEYLAFLNFQLWQKLSTDMLQSYESSLAALNSRYEVRKNYELQRLNDELLKLKENFLIAQSLKIQEIPYASLENIQLKILDGKDYLLGTNLLNQQIAILTERSKGSLSPFSQDLRNLENSMVIIQADIEKLKSIKNIKMFEVVNPAQASIRPVKPNKTLILFGVVFMSGFIGMIYLLIRSSLIKRRQVTE